MSRIMAFFILACATVGPLRAATVVVTAHATVTYIDENCWSEPCPSLSNLPTLGTARRFVLKANKLNLPQSGTVNVLFRGDSVYIGAVGTSNGSVIAANGYDDTASDICGGPGFFATSASFRYVDVVGCSHRGYADVVYTASKVQLSLHNTDGAVPEPGSWALLILGFHAVGSSLRRKRASEIRQLSLV